MFKFKVGELVKYAPEFCSDGEEKYIHVIREQRYSPVTGKPTRYIIETLNTRLSLGSQEEIEDYMIQTIEQKGEQ